MIVRDETEVRALIQTIGEPRSPVRWFHGSLEHGAIIGADDALLREWRASQADAGGGAKP
jgi:hypothetical protein